jgi:hypothetical protein
MEAKKRWTGMLSKATGKRNSGKTAAYDRLALRNTGTVFFI